MYSAEGKLSADSLYIWPYIIKARPYILILYFYTLYIYFYHNVLFIYELLSMSIMFCCTSKWLSLAVKRDKIGHVLKLHREALVDMKTILIQEIFMNDWCLIQRTQERNKICRESNKI